MHKWFANNTWLIFLHLQPELGLTLRSLKGKIINHCKYWCNLKPSLLNILPQQWSKSIFFIRWDWLYGLNNNIMLYDESRPRINQSFKSNSLLIIWHRTFTRNFILFQRLKIASQTIHFGDNLVPSPACEVDLTYN